MTRLKNTHTCFKNIRRIWTYAGYFTYAPILTANNMFYALTKDHDLSYFFEHIIGITRTNAIAVAAQINKTVIDKAIPVLVRYNNIGTIILTTAQTKHKLPHNLFALSHFSLLDINLLSR